MDNLEIDSIFSKNSNQNDKEIILDSSTSNKSSQLDIYEALHQVGSEHIYQKRFFLFSAFVWLFGAASILSSIFTFEKPGFNCPPEIKSDDCENWVCKQANPRDYFSTNPESFVMLFDPPILCDRQYIADLSIAINYAGSALGLIVSLYIADNLGRKLATVIFWILASVGALISCFFGYSMSLSVFGFALSQFGANSTINIVFCMMNDHSLGKFREYSMAALNPFYGVGGSLLVLMVYISPNFRIIMLLIGLPILFSCSYLHYIYDPPLFLFEKDKNKTVEVLNKIAKVNQRNGISSEELKNNDFQVNKSRIYGIHDLFAFPSLKQNAIFSGLVLFFIQISYYGSNLTLSQIGLDTKTNALATSFADTIGYLVVIPIIPFIKRKKWCILTRFIFSSIFMCFYFIKIPDDCGDSCSEKILQAILVAVARFFLTFEWGIAFIYIAELFPTTVRTIGLGFASVVGEVGSILCSYFVSYFISWGINPLFGLGFISFLSIIFYYPIEETFEKPNQSEIKELIEIELQKVTNFKQPFIDK